MRSPELPVEKSTSRVTADQEACRWTGQLGMPLFPEAGVCVLRRSHPLRPHRNAGYEITVLLAGEVAWVVKGGPRLHLRGGEMAITPPEALHGGEFEIIQPCELLYLVVAPSAPGALRGTPFSAAELRQLEARLRAAGNRTAPASAGLLGAFRGLLRLWHAPPDAFSQAEAKLLLLEALLWAARSMDTREARHDHPAVAAAQDWMARHPSKPLVVAELAARVGLSVSRFHDVFKHAVGQSPADYFNRLRCGLARTRLQQEALPVTRLAYELGYSSSQYFARSFRRYTGMSPRAWRLKAGRRP